MMTRGLRLGSRLGGTPSLLIPVLLTALLVVVGARAQTSYLDKLDDSLFFQTKGGFFRTDLSGLFDLEGYFIDQRPPAIIFGNGDAFIVPRLSLFLDTRLGPHLYSFVQGRIDRGFDPRALPRSARFDEYLLRWTPFDDTRLNLQVGKFATVAGNWIQRHDSWNNPFINAPLAYEYVTTITDKSVPGTPAAFLVRRDIPDKKGDWVPVIWGPSYATGASMFGQLGQFDYAFEIKSAGLSSRPYAWDARDHPINNPTVTAHAGWRPSAMWNVGASVSEGTYLTPSATLAAFPAGARIADFRQITFAQDASWSWHHWQVWAEVFESRFEVPNVGDADTLAYYIEAKYKLTPRLFAAARWNQQLFAKVTDGAGGMQDWDRDVWRADAALVFRYSRHLQGKIQYSYQRQDGRALQQGEQLVAAQVTVKF